jgi:antitoxin component of MazEF toxin-antitoxin module
MEKEDLKLPKIQEQKGSLVTTIPKEVKEILGLEKGDYINFNIENGEVKVVKIKGVEKVIY